MLTGYEISGHYIRTPHGLFMESDFDSDELCEIKQLIYDELKLPGKSCLEHIELSDTLSEINKLILLREVEKIGDARKGVELL